MTKVNFQSRKDRVFEYIVTAYIELGMPVGSETLCKRSNLGLCPATVRNIMRELEDIKYITHPHTSAGRIPTDAGYRYYVDKIMVPENITQPEQESIRSICSSPKGQPETLLEKALKLLAQISKEASLVLFPKLKKNLLKEIKLVSFGNNKAVAVLIAGSGLIKVKDFQLKDAIDDQYLQKIAIFINNNCINKPLSQAKEVLETIALSARDFSYYLCKDALQILQKLDIANETDKLFLDGTYYLFQQPEFKDVGKSKRLVRLFEEKKGLLEFVEDSLDSESEGIKISIGKENVCLDMQDCSIVISGYGPEDNILGAIGVIGPTRMSYKRVVPVVDCMASQISSILRID